MMVEEYRRDLCHSDVQPQIEERTQITKTPAVTNDEIRDIEKYEKGKIS